MKAIIICIILSLASGALTQPTINVECDLLFINNVYTCRLPAIDLAAIGDFVISSNNHLQNQNDASVQSFVSVNNNFLSFPTQHLIRFPNLVMIKITGSRITELRQGDIINRPLLRTLNLNANLINHIDPAAFIPGTTGIDRFHLLFNRLTHIDNSVFLIFPNLVELDLSSNLFTEVDRTALQNNSLLTALSMNSNQITFMEPAFLENLANLQTFNFLTNPCYSGSFVDVNTPFGRAEMMRRLEPCFTIGPRVLNCEFAFEFQGVSFDGLYTCLLRQIEVLDRNQLIDLRGFHLTGQNNANVRHVWIDLSNSPYIITRIFATFLNLERLFIQGSNLQYLTPGDFLGASSLKDLRITMNALRRLEAYSFQHAVFLEDITMWFNSLESIDEMAFMGLSNLRELHLYSGYLTQIPPNTFLPCTSLYLVEIGENRLETIDHRWFANNTHIGQLLFNSNRISQIFPEILNITTLTTLNLRNNICIDAEFTITNENREQVRDALNECFDKYPLRVQHFYMELEGDLELFHENGTHIISL